MASAPPELSPRHLLALGLFVFGMDTLPYNQFQRRIDWRHARSERHGARAASQYIGPGQDAITLGGLLVPGVHGGFGDIDRLIAMADSGDHWPLVDGTGLVLGEYHILALDQNAQHVMAGGIPRAVDFIIDLDRVD